MSSGLQAARTNYARQLMYGRELEGAIARLGHRAQETTGPSAHPQVNDNALLEPSASFVSPSYPKSPLAAPLARNVTAPGTFSDPYSGTGTVNSGGPWDPGGMRTALEEEWARLPSLDRNVSSSSESPNSRSGWGGVLYHDELLAPRLRPSRLLRRARSTPKSSGAQRSCRCQCRCPCKCFKTARPQAEPMQTTPVMRRRQGLR